MDARMFAIWASPRIVALLQVPGLPGKIWVHDAVEFGVVGAPKVRVQPRACAYKLIKFKQAL